MLKSDIIWPDSCRYKSHSEWEPIGFFSDCLCNSTSFDLMLGFFSSSAINVLCDGFAVFLHNGGRMRLIINDILSDDDRDAIKNGLKENDESSCFDMDNLAFLKSTLSVRDRHFFECISWLIRNDRIEIRIIRPADGNGIAHTKCGTFSDGLNNVCFEGSVNFSYSALVHNMESMSVACDWNGKTDVARILDTQTYFNDVFEGKDEGVTFIDVEHVKADIVESFQSKDLAELLEDEQNILDDKKQDSLPLSVLNALLKAKNKVKTAIERYKTSPSNNMEEPHFPYPSGPRKYQEQAYENWKLNNQKGLFAMATGTGKTLTSLNCLLHIYNKFHFYKAIILVPTITLVDQWAEECKKFGFTNITKVCSKSKSWKSEIDTIKYKEDFNLSGDEPSYIIISTYASMARDSIFKDLVSFNKKALRQILLIADEAHNMGSGRIMDKLEGIKFLRRIGLSATPERQFDDKANRTINQFFGCNKDAYTFEFSMREAIDKGFLCRYYYYPHIVKLTDDEMFEYMKISTQLAKFFNFDDNSFPEGDDILTLLLLKRKRIIHKALNKREVFKQIINDRFHEKGNLKYTLVYVPEGNKPDNDKADYFDTNESVTVDEDSEHLIDIYTQIVQDVSPKTTVKKFVSGISERNQILADFASGELEVLTSMKCLDEGVDVPRSELAIFCASTGNPRQFIQRRGRILRNHPDKHMAIIHDLVVVPDVSYMSDSYSMEQRMLKSELTRVRDFAVLSENADFAFTELDEILSYYNLSLF